ncbi:MAG: DUF1326 domain-containing protein [Armatimonadota bacterium]|nr:DUF1326 domain-containing protein [Armatimonadota bacterium]
MRTWHILSPHYWGLGGILLLGLLRPVTAAPAYEAAGVALHQCSCAYACPCMFENGPDNCALAAVYHLDQAAYDGVDISGLSMISIDGAVDAHRGGLCCAKSAPKTAKTNASDGVVYLDNRATPRQRQALLGLLEAHGEWPGAGRPVKSVPIAFSKTAQGYKTVVPGLFEGETEAVKSRRGTRIVVDGVGFAEGERWTVGRSLTNNLHDAALGLKWHLPGTNGSWSLFHWASEPKS